MPILNPSRLRALTELKKGPMPADAITRKGFNRRTFRSLEELGMARLLRTGAWKMTAAGRSSLPK